MSAIGGFLSGLFGLAGTQLQNNQNMEIANMNLQYQRERNAIEDERYADETAYNRTFAEDERNYQRNFAEDERAYNRALQQEIFNREDTALTRQASELSNLGINPLSQQMNGLNAGQALSASSPGVEASAPGMSSHTGQALHNDFKSQWGNQAMAALSSAMDISEAIHQMKTGELNRDALMLKNDEQYLKNLAEANKYGINYLPGLGIDYKNHHTMYNGYKAVRETGEDLQDFPTFTYERENAYQKSYKSYLSYLHDIDSGIFDSDDDKTKLIKNLSNLDFTKIAENILTQSAKFSDELSNYKNDKRFENSPIMKFFNLFW